MRLDNTKIQKWKDLVDAFVKQYKYNMDIAPDRTSLSNLEKRDKENIREYAQRWRDLAAQVHPLLLDKEMVTLFANTLKDPHYEHVMGSSAQQFIDVVAVAERIEQGVKSGRIFAPTEKKKASKVKRKRLTMLRVGRTHSKNTTLHPFHPKSPTSISTLLFLPENLNLKPNTKKSKNNYLHYRCP
jgi:hypothetical protein